MRRKTLLKMVLMAGGYGFLLQATTGCPNGAALRTVGSTSMQALISGVLGLYIKAGTNQLFNV